VRGERHRGSLRALNASGSCSLLTVNDICVLLQMGSVPPPDRRVQVTGARFALLPPDDGTGNLVKIVQCVPVLIRLDGPPGVELRPGMSAE
jgi:hypothetical protein